MTIELVVAKTASGLRIDRYLANELRQFSRTRLQHLIRHGFVRLNGEAVRARDPIRSGDRIQVCEPPLEKTENEAEAIPLEILFEDQDLLVINKPAGLVVHPGAGHRELTLVNALLHHCPPFPESAARNDPVSFIVSIRRPADAWLWQRTMRRIADYLRNLRRAR